MIREAIVHAASKMETTHDLLVLLNRIKMDELGDKGHPFTMPQLNYFINPKRNSLHYKTFFIPKKSGGQREISAPTHILKSLQTYMNRILQAFYDAPEYVTGFVPSKSIVDNAERHIGMRYIFNSDLKDFFPSIAQARVWGALQTRPFSFSKEIASAIAGLCCIEAHNEEGELIHVLPQGSPCSPTLTNIVCHNLDWKLNGLAKRFHLKYSRYADDITFSSDHYVYQDDGEFAREFRRIVAGQHFKLNEKKTRIQKRGERQEVTGLVVSERANVAREYVRDIDNLLYIWEKHGHNAAFAKYIARYTPKQDLRKGFPDMNSVIMGRLMYLRMVKGEDNLVWRRLQKRFNRLADKKESCGGTNIQYLHAYPIASFENAVKTDLSFTLDNDFVRCSFTLNGSVHSARLGKYAKTRIRSILEGGSEDALQFFKEKFHIGFCHMEGTPEEDHFWMVFRRPPKAKGLEITDVNEILFLTDSVGLPESGETDSADSLTTNAALEALISSDFDLNTLDKWDKIKSS